MGEKASDSSWFVVHSSLLPPSGDVGCGTVFCLSFWGFVVDYGGKAKRRQRRVRKIVYGEPNVVREYCYDGDQVLNEYDDGGTLKRTFIYGDGIDEPLCVSDAVGGASYYHYDGLGSVAAMSDGSGDIRERCEYDVYGGCIVHTDAGQDGQWMTTDTESGVGNPYMFTGRRYDAESGLYYYRARYYSPEIGRFLAPDPIGYVAGLNLYAYVNNNSVNRKDPVGLFSLEPGFSDDEVLEVIDNIEDFQLPCCRLWSAPFYQQANMSPHECVNWYLDTVYFGCPYEVGLGVGAIGCIGYLPVGAGILTGSALLYIQAWEFCYSRDCLEWGTRADCKCE